MGNGWRNLRWNEKHVRITWKLLENVPSFTLRRPTPICKQTARKKNETAVFVGLVENISNDRQLITYSSIYSIPIQTSTRFLLRYKLLICYQFLNFAGCAKINYFMIGLIQILKKKKRCLDLNVEDHLLDNRRRLHNFGIFSILKPTWTYIDILHSDKFFFLFFQEKKQIIILFRS